MSIAHHICECELFRIEKNIKKVAKNRCNNLLLDFLSSKSNKSGDWQKDYLVNGKDSVSACENEVCGVQLFFDGIPSK